ncbi:hypothetical protein KIW84_074391 [Lathyrus oleraceus]|uniref:Uncharacterized protein n=1 Tax=Pisum sativum TaxID=3888 RepID=A0A9D4ZWT6_PEA|nr:hypothetical protein KIW84_074391 [Pisum sativum]
MSAYHLHHLSFLAAVERFPRLWISNHLNPSNNYSPAASSLSTLDVTSKDFNGRGYDDSDRRIPDMTIITKQLGSQPPKPPPPRLLQLLGLRPSGGTYKSGTGIHGDFNLNNFEDGVLSSAFMVGLLHWLGNVEGFI